MPQKRWRIELAGLLQGIGFRPLAWHIANSLGLSGWIRNQDQGVVIEIQGPMTQLERFISSLESQLPEQARIDSKRIEDCPIDESPETQEFKFKIVSSVGQNSFHSDSTPDLAPCPNCLSELFNSENRRYLYPLISCTRCGPRYSITESSPFDRQRTTLVEFPLCHECLSEYSAPSNRRFHAQTIGCFHCGPQWVWRDRDSPPIVCNNPSAVGSMLNRFERILNDNGVVLIKGVGGYQLLCDATSYVATKRIRKLKRREHKPFAVLVDSVQSALDLVKLTTKAASTLQRPERPIIVGHLQKSCQLLSSNPGLSPFSGSLGVMLPNNPMQFLLAGTTARPMLLTSANISNEPMWIDDRLAIDRFENQVDAVLTHSRKIAQPLDDPVHIDTVAGLIPIRLGRGDSPCRLPFRGWDASPTTSMALGADLKAAWALHHSDSIYLMQQLGDASNPSVLDRLEQSVAKVLESQLPTESLICDLHPDYHTRILVEKLSSAGYRKQKPLVCQTVQHHAAHLASLAVDMEIPFEEPFVGFVFDGTGLGADGSIWGGELIGVREGEYRRLGHLRNFRLPMGDLAARYPWRSALALLVDCGITIDELVDQCECFKDSPWGKLTDSERSAWMRSSSTPSLTIPSSSMGRWLEGIASLIGLVHTNDYEGHAAMALEDLASVYRRQELDPSAIDIELAQESYRFETRLESSSVQFDGRNVVRGVIKDLCRGISKQKIAYRVHASIAMLLVEALRLLESPWGMSRNTGLTGGVFQNRLLTELGSSILEKFGYRACIHRRIPPNDSGIAVGQLRLANPGPRPSINPAST